MKDKRKKGKKLYYSKWWRRAIVIAMIVITLSLVIEIFFPQLIENTIIGGFLRIMDFPLSLFLLLDIGMQFNDAKNKRRFFRNHALEILSCVPFAAIFLFFRTLRLVSVVETVPFMARLLTVERVAKLEKGFKLFEGLVELFRIKI